MSQGGVDSILHVLRMAGHLASVNFPGDYGLSTTPLKYAAQRICSSCEGAPEP
jgi:hypothetical protein